MSTACPPRVNLLIFLVLGPWVVACAQVFAPLQQAQFERATELTAQLRYDEAYPYWENLAQLEVEQDSTSFAFIEQAFEVALQTERFEAAMRWLDLLGQRRDWRASDWISRIELLKRLGRYQQIPEALASGVSSFPGDSVLLAHSEAWPTIEGYLQDTVAWPVWPYRPTSKNEEFAPFPRRGGLVFATSGVPAGFSNDGWTGQPWTKLAWIPDTATAEPQWREWQKLLGKHLFPGLNQTLHHNGPVSFSSDRNTALVTRNQRELNPEGAVNVSALELVFYYDVIGEGWMGPEPFPHNSPMWSTGHGCFDLEEAVIFASNRPGGYGGVDLWRSERSGQAWSEPVNLGPAVNSSADDCFPYVADDGTLYFASNRVAGLGGLDLYSWWPGAGAAEHLPAPVNSTGDDFAMHVEPSGKAWFSSNRVDAIDRIYRVDLPVERVSWELLVQTCDTRPLPDRTLIAEYESSGISFELKTDFRGVARFSPRSGQAWTLTMEGSDSLEAIGPLRYPAQEQGNYQDSLTLKWLNPEGLVRVVDQTGSALGGALLTFRTAEGNIRKETVNADGEYRWITEESRIFNQLSVDLINYEAKTIPLVGFNGCPRPERYTVVLEEIPIEEVIDLNLILYDTDKWDLRPASKRELDKLVLFLQQRPMLRVELSSHTDCRNSHEYNMLLSQRRAQSCVDYIVSRGIDAGRIVARGYGETRLVNRCSDGVTCSEAEHQENRRTELEFLTD